VVQAPVPQKKKKKKKKAHSARYLRG
jgi:hypothetical protein